MTRGVEYFSDASEELWADVQPSDTVAMDVIGVDS
ncbi:hypothetical protein MHIR_DE00391 [Candidatus Doolittlea endobia]|uniref:Uncharacterized protein n=1 Tax=Candidatus Doolittlea endobia TaxID=1778262 RepID=A0A143WSE4_9ENTR|nr:hypothetical protein MHIR_DE00391 [Candidatus Doolittlea endobia]